MGYSLSLPRGFFILLPWMWQQSCSQDVVPLIDGPYIENQWRVRFTKSEQTVCIVRPCSSCNKSVIIWRSNDRELWWPFWIRRMIAGWWMGWKLSPPKWWGCDIERGINQGLEFSVLKTAGSVYIFWHLDTVNSLVHCTLSSDFMGIVQNLRQCWQLKENLETCKCCNCFGICTLQKFEIICPISWNHLVCIFWKFPSPGLIW